IDANLIVCHKVNITHSPSEVKRLVMVFFYYCDPVCGGNSSIVKEFGGTLSAHWRFGKYQFSILPTIFTDHSLPFLVCARF
ncbi:MAG TPA: hypothetical protein VMV80_04825, partial [Anaerolineales bacterium]|nr:hypothetical protein [Anaerolineales bacterium]